MFLKGGWDFPKIKRNFYKKWGEPANPACFMKTPLYCLPHFFKFCPPASPPTSLSPQTPTPTPTVLSVVLFLWLNGWSHHIWCAILLNDNMDLHMLSLCTLPPEGHWCVFYATRCQLYWGVTYKVIFYWYSDFVITHTHSTLRS